MNNFWYDFMNYSLIPNHLPTIGQLLIIFTIWTLVTSIVYFVYYRVKNKEKSKMKNTRDYFIVGLTERQLKMFLQIEKELKKRSRLK